MGRRNGTAPATLPLLIQYEAYDMKLGTLKNAERTDGDLVVVSRDNTKAVKAGHIVASLREAIEAWDDVAPKLQALSDDLNAGNAADSFPVDQSAFHSPLPRAWQWLDGSAYVQHVILVRKARGAEPPEDLMTNPLMYQGCSDAFLAPTQDIPHADSSWGVDFEGEVAVVTDEVPMGTSAEDALKHIKLIMLVNDVSLRGLIPPELRKGFGFLVSKPASAFSPFAVTPDELGDAWKGGMVHRNLDVTYNGEFYGNADASHMQFHFGELLAHAAQTRVLSAGTIMGSGTVSNKDISRGSSCLAEKRMLEKIDTGEFITPFMKPGDTIRIEMSGEDGNNIFGTIDQKVVQVDL